MSIRQHDLKELRIYKKRREATEIEKQLKENTQKYLKNVLKDSNENMIKENLKFNKLWENIEKNQYKHAKKINKYMKK